MRISGFLHFQWLAPLTMPAHPCAGLVFTVSEWKPPKIQSKNRAHGHRMCCFFVSDCYKTVKTFPQFLWITLGMTWWKYPGSLKNTGPFLNCLKNKQLHFCLQNNKIKNHSGIQSFSLNRLTLSRRAVYKKLLTIWFFLWTILLYRQVFLKL